MSRSVVARLLRIIAAIAIVVLSAIILRPHPTEGPGNLSLVVSRLRRLNEAKQQWILEHGSTNALEKLRGPSEIAQLVPYLVSSGMRPVLHEAYRLNPQDGTPEAVLSLTLRDSALPRSLPKNTIVRLNHDGDILFVFPEDPTRTFKLDAPIKHSDYAQPLLTRRVPSFMTAPDDPPRFSGSWLMIAVPLTVVALLIALAIPNGPTSRTSRLNTIFNNLRLIDGAKQQWASAHGITNSDHMLYFSDIAPWLRNGYRDRYGCGFGTNGYPHPLDNVEYIVNPFGLSPEAHLTKPFDGGYLPAGTIIRFETNGIVECIRPDIRL